MQESKRSFMESGKDHKDSLVTFFYFSFLFILLINLIKYILAGYTEESWKISEFLINYQGGFVRRGLLGEILLKIHSYLGLNPYTIIILICSFAYLILIGFFIRTFINNGYTLFILPFVFFLGNPIINDFWVRKDILLVLIFILVIYYSIKTSDRYLILVNLFFIIGLLIHESIGFFCFPILLLIYISKNQIKKEYTPVKSIIISIFQLLPSLFTFLCVLYYHGSKSISNQIWNSWKHITFPFHVKEYNQIPKALEGLSWSLEEGLSFTVKTLNNFSDHVYAPVSLLLILLTIYYILTNTDKLNFKILKFKPHKNFNKEFISSTLVFQFFTVVPLFILGWDYSRWIFFWVISSFVINIFVPEKKLSVLFPAIIIKVSGNLNGFLDSILSNTQSFLFLLCIFIGIPPYSWSFISYVNTSAIVISLQFFSLTLQKLLLFVKEFV